MSTNNPAFEITEEDSKGYLECLVRDYARTIQKIFFDCMRVARRLQIMLPYRTLLAEFFKWSARNTGGVLKDFLQQFSPREVFEHALQTLNRHRRERQLFWLHAASTLQ